MAEQGQENFRDTIGTLNNEGDRAWVFPKKPRNHSRTAG